MIITTRDFRTLFTYCLVGCLGFCFGYTFGTNSSLNIERPSHSAVPLLEYRAINNTDISVAHLRRPKHKTSAASCADKEIPRAVNMHSQSGEDKQLLMMFAGLCKGVYVEMGALNGLQFSNSYVFSRDLGWKGVLVEPSPSSFAQLKKNRPNELRLVNAAVCKEEGIVHFIDLGVSAVGGIWEFSAPAFRKTFWKNKNLKDGVPINCFPLRNILANVSKDATFYADFFSLDVEGGELQVRYAPSIAYFETKIHFPDQVLESLDLNSARFGAILVEADGLNASKDGQVRALLTEAGYSHIGHFHRSDWFINADWDELYSGLGLKRPASF